MRSKICLGLLAVSIIIVMIISGCAGRERDEGDQEWRRGTEGIKMDFLPSSPLSVLYDDDSIDIAIEMWNRGAFPLYGDLYLTGFDEDIFQGITQTPIRISIDETKSKYNDEGGYEVIKQAGRVRLPEGVNVLPTKLNAVACYYYETMIDIPVCVDPEPNKRDASFDACQPRDVGTGGGQAAPVGVTHVEIDSTPQKAIFKISLQNLGKGDILDQALVDECLDADVTYADVDWVDIISVRLGVREELICEPSNPIKMRDGHGKITCWTSNLQGANAYATTLHVEFGYGYRELISKNLELRSNI